MVVTDVSKSNKSPQLNDQQIKDLVDIVHGAIEIGVKELSVYAFSTENWRRCQSASELCSRRP